MPSVMPLQTNRPIKQYDFQITYNLDDGTTVQQETPVNQRSIMLGILNQLAQYYAPANFPGNNTKLRSLTIKVGNRQDTLPQNGQ